MSNQIRFQLEVNKNLQQHCGILEGELDSLLDQANARITGLTEKLKDMELEEAGLRRKCDDLRNRLTDKTAALSTATELYNRIKQKCGLNSPPTADHDIRQPRHAADTNSHVDRLANPAPYGNQAQVSHRGLLGGDMNQRPDYISANSTSRTQAIAGPLRSAPSRYTSNPKSHHLQTGNHRTEGLTSVSNNAPGTARTSSRFHQPINTSQNHAVDSFGRHLGTNLDSGVRFAHGQADPAGLRAPLGRAGRDGLTNIESLARPPPRIYDPPPGPLRRA
ncbi:hypothetical protein B0H66DRAFT_557772 [Apodospora peruviana]|uniref:Uncharacterized protein n=1 Tax=Apodospora peruviana TaxID=516989 RepID=A0AAE0M470_9PEZI|nr:hypothetical protein B0H66DRAFT_557772 [Apodospora peruviana]